MRAVARTGAQAAMLLFWVVLAAAVFLEALRQYASARLASGAAVTAEPADPQGSSRTALSVDRIGMRPHWIRRSPEGKPA